MLADAYQAKGDKKTAALATGEIQLRWAAAIRQLIKRLASLEQEAGENEKAAAALERLNYIYPRMKNCTAGWAICCWRRTTSTGRSANIRPCSRMKPLDQAASHYELAKALRMANRTDDARDQVLLALEAAPGYKPAQQLLLELSK